MRSLTFLQPFQHILDISATSLAYIRHFCDRFSCQHPVLPIYYYNVDASNREFKLNTVVQLE